MNWNYWLPWRDYPQDDSKDSTYESEVIKRCDHDWGDWQEDEDGEARPVLYPQSTFCPAPTVENGHLVFAILTEKTKYCKLCGEQDGPRLVPDGRGAIPLSFRLDEDVSLSEALSEPVEADADFVVREDGETEKVSGEDEGRVLVNRKQQGKADDKPVKAGGATD
jgi:hypothetical protein